MFDDRRNTITFLIIRPEQTFVFQLRKRLFSQHFIILELLFYAVNVIVSQDSKIVVVKEVDVEARRLRNFRNTPHQEEAPTCQFKNEIDKVQLNFCSRFCSIRREHFLRQQKW